MPPSLADSFAHALGFLSIDGKADIHLGTQDERDAAEQLLHSYIAAYYDMDEFEPRHVLLAQMTDFASRFLPAFADLFIYSAFGLEEDELIYQARTWLRGLGTAPAFGRFLRERPDAYKALFNSKLARLAMNEGHWDSKLLHAPTRDGHVRRDHFGVLVQIVNHLLAFANYHGRDVAFFEVPPDLASQANRLVVHLKASRPSTARTADLEHLPERLQSLDGVVQVISYAPKLRLDIPIDYRYWKRCEASVLPGVDACVKVPAGKEMACCSKCLGVRYCSPAHQKSHWKTHKPVCFKPTW